MSGAIGIAICPSGVVIGVLAHNIMWEGGKTQSKNKMRSILELEFELHPIFQSCRHLSFHFLPTVLLGQLLRALLASEEDEFFIEEQSFDLPAVADEVAEFFGLLG